ncbi:DUF177 domain-containing protein [Natroniella acetigena]|uniref:YceD family protein n=1 Tax=Natroniella acetigena TaxID=52004 RepID=UPI00200AD8D5|nr:DUF177 domain-containing protein [Natroniella acetigena]MCK8827246.1 DUF177 domain-containing protein [Natroniella acetigena]
MKVNIAEIKDDLGAMMTVEMPIALNNKLIEEQKITVVDPSSLELKIINSEGEYVVVGTASLSLQAICSRCLEKFKRSLEFEIKGEVPEEEVEDVELDISNILVEHIRLATPMKYICDEDCQGLCPNCGKNLNEEDCDCIMHKVDPRLAKLEKLLPDKE